MPYSTALPQNKRSAAHDDAEKGANLIWQYAEQLGIERQRITLAGDSAGGHGAGDRITPEGGETMAARTTGADLPDARRDRQM